GTAHAYDRVEASQRGWIDEPAACIDRHSPPTVAEDGRWTVSFIPVLVFLCKVRALSVSGLVRLYR
ncbi:MAG: hypothetical protein JW940_28200, partial [Polyangiaceae bacterium]|nr:hypothetical protein [Polyangiaceae bacterium]